jgi:hypothetical protein
MCTRLCRGPKTQQHAGFIGFMATSPSPAKRRPRQPRGDLVAHRPTNPPTQIGKAPREGPFRQRACKPDPVASGHLSRRGLSPAGAAESGSCDLPGPRRAGSTVLLGLAPGGVCLAAASPRRRCALTAPFHLCLYAAHVWPRHRPCVSVALSRGFPRVGVTHRPALWCPDFPRGRGFSLPRVRLARTLRVGHRRRRQAAPGDRERRGAPAAD